MIKIGITQGDINGVGYEVIFKTFEVEEMLSLCTPVIYGSPKAATYHRKSFNNQTSFQVIDSATEAKNGTVNMINCFGEDELKIDFGCATEDAGKAALISLNAALEDLKEGNIDALVTLPINDATVKGEEGTTFAGQKEYIDSLIGEGRRSLNLLVSDNIRIALTTNNIPISQVTQHINREIIAEKLVILHNTLKRDLYIDNPRIAVLALNPKFNPEDENTEEKECIVPVIEELFKRGVRSFGPYEADDFFGSGNFKHFDATLAMYHDQGFAPFKALAMNEGLIYSAGLPAIITSPAHGTEYAIAGKGEADESSLRQAIYTAIDVVRNRSRFDNARRNPLKKQYFEKRDDSDKLKLDQVDDE